MGLWKPGELSISLYMLELLRKQVKDEYPCDDGDFLINEVLPLPEDHPDNVYAREHNSEEYHCLVEVTYNTRGHRAGYGLTDSGKWHCFYS